MLPRSRSACRGRCDVSIGTGLCRCRWGQQRLWFLEQLAPGTATYHIPTALRFEGDLSLDALEASLTELARRHEVLRTSFPAVDGLPVQRISAPAPVRVKVVDLSTLGEAVRTAAIKQHVTAETQTPFALGEAAPWRTALFRLAPQDAVLVLTFHHIITDGWSMGIVLRELSSLVLGVHAWRDPGASGIAGAVRRLRAVGTRGVE